MWTRFYEARRAVCRALSLRLTWDVGENGEVLDVDLQVEDERGWMVLVS
jgi:hypothetical protein